MSASESLVTISSLGKVKDLPPILATAGAYLFAVVASGLTVIGKRKMPSYLLGGDKYMYTETYFYSLLYTTSLLGLQKMDNNFPLVMTLTPIMIVVIDIVQQNIKNVMISSLLIVVVTIGMAVSIGLLNNPVDWVIGSMLALLLAGRHLIASNILKLKSPITAINAQSNTDYVHQKFLLVNICILFNTLFAAIFLEGHSLAEIGILFGWTNITTTLPRSSAALLAHFLYLLCGNVASALSMSVAYNLQHIFVFIRIATIKLSISAVQVTSILITIVAGVGLIFFDVLHYRKYLPEAHWHLLLPFFIFCVVTLLLC